MNKRGQEINITTIIIVVLAILVLVIVAAAFTGGMKEMIDKIKASLGMYQASDTEEAKNMCDVWCSQGLTDTWNSYTFKKLAEDKNTCAELTGTTCSKPQS